MLLKKKYSDNNSLFINFSWALIGNFVYACSQWVMIVVLAKMGTAQMVGRFALGLAITAPVISLTNLQLREIQATDINSEYKFSDYLGLRLCSCLSAITVVLCIVIWGGYNRDVIIVVLILAIAKAVESVSDVFHGLLQRLERMDLLSISKLIKGPLSVLALFVGLYYGGLKWALLGMLISWVLVLILYDMKSAVAVLAGKGELRKKLVRPKFKLRRIGTLAWATLPMGIGALLLSLDENLPRLFIEHILGEATLGIFAAMAYIQVAGTTVVRALTYSAAPILSRAYASPNHVGFVPLLSKLILFGGAIGIILLLASILVGKELLTVFYRPGYAIQVNVFVWLMVGATLHFIAMFLSSGVVVVRHFRSAMTLEFIVLLVIAMGSYHFVPRLGLLGAALALGAGALTRSVGAAVIIIYAVHFGQEIEMKNKGRSLVPNR